MNLTETLKLAWENKTKIAEGLYNTYIDHKPEIEEEGKRRRAICESNVCGLYDVEGKAETSAIPGRPTCTFCHCNIQLKTNCLSCYCSMGDRDRPGDMLQMDKALWLAITDNEIEKEIRETEWEKQNGIVFVPPPPGDKPIPTDGNKATHLNTWNSNGELID